MARLPYADPKTTLESDPDLVHQIIDQRGGMLHLYAMLLQSPRFAEGWLQLLTAVRHKSRLPGALREMMIMRVAHLNAAPYEAEQHRPIALAEGLSDAQVDALADWQSVDLFDPAQRAALAYCDAMTREVHVPPAVFEALRPHYAPPILAELTITIAAYNMVSRVLEALEISSSDDMGQWQ